MKFKINLKKNVDYIKLLFLSLLSTWLISGAILNIKNRSLDYLTLPFSGAYDLALHLGLGLVFLILILFLCRNYISEALRLSFLIFFATMLPFKFDEFAPFGLALLLLCALYSNLLYTYVNRNHNTKRIFTGLLIVLNSFILVQFCRLFDFSYFKLIFNKRVPRLNMQYHGRSVRIVILLVLLFLLFLILIKKVTDTKLKIITFFLFCVQAYILGIILYSRFASFGTPTFDFNLFAQMFYSMSKGLGPMTTLERNLPLSHFKVHVSPIYYLMLPFYMITKDPGTVQILQGVVVALGIFPFIKIAKLFNIPNRICTFLGVIYLLNPALLLSNLYDLHENCFLVPLLLWLIYFIEKRNNVGMIAFTLLTLLVKEDASIYIWTLALFMMLDKKMIKEGLIMFFSSSLYFLGCMQYLKSGGQGAMLGRFDNFVSFKKLSILSVPLTLLKNPGFFFKTIFHREKFIYVLQVLLPLGLTPLLNSKYTRLILFIPLLVMNLLPDYLYQSNIMFQYNYGSTVFLIYLMLLYFRDLYNEEAIAETIEAETNAVETKEVETKEVETNEIHTNEIESKKKIEPVKKSETKNKVKNLSLSTSSLFNIRNIWITLLLIVSIYTGLTYSMPQLLIYNDIYVKGYKVNIEKINHVKSILNQIPEEASVITTPYLTGYLHNRSNLYDVENNFKNPNYYRADFAIIDIRGGLNDTAKKYIAKFTQDGYTEYYNDNKTLVILKKPN